MSRLWNQNQIRQIVASELNRRPTPIHGTQSSLKGTAGPREAYRFINTTGGIIPAYAILQPKEVIDAVQSAESDKTIWVLDVEQTTDAPTDIWFVNLGADIEEGGSGFCTLPTDPTKILMDPDAAAPTFLATFGPVANKWHLSTAGTGFKWLGLTDDNEDGTRTALFREVVSSNTFTGAVLLGSQVASDFASSGNDAIATFLFKGNPSAGVDTTTAANRLKIITAGHYQVSYNLSALVTATSNQFTVDYQIFKNDSDAGEQYAAKAWADTIGYRAVALSQPIRLAVDDVIDLRIDTGTNAIRFNTSSFSITRVGD